MRDNTYKKLPIHIDDKDLVQLYKQVIDISKTLSDWRHKVDLSFCAKDLLSLFSMTEAVESTKIEGTQATLSDVLEDVATNSERIDTNEVRNYREAVQYGIDYIDEYGMINIRLFKKLHEVLLTGNVRGKNKSPGEFRKIDNWIGDETSTMETASYVPPSHIEVDDYMKNLEEYINDNSIDVDLDPLMKAAIIHVQFETIHPFLDGNGRVGRILIILYLYLQQVIPNGAFFISRELEKNKEKYYELLNGYREEPPRIVEWISFFLSSIKKEADNQKEKLDQVDVLARQYWSLHKSDAYRKVLVAIFQHPVFTVKMIEEITGLSNNTTRSYINDLESHNLIYANNKSRNRTYYCSELLKILAN